jgi:spermidine/putrescine transport system permease protein
MYLKHLKHILVREKPFFVGVVPLLWQVLFFYVPLAFIILLSITRLAEGTVLGLTLEYYAPFLTSTYVLVLLRSLMLALVNVLLCFMVGFPLAYFLAFRAGRFKMVFLFLLLLPFWTNFLLHIYAWFFVLDRGGVLNTLLLKLGLISRPLELLNSLGAIVLVMLYAYLPFMVLPLYSVLERIDRKVLEASYDLGATGWQTVRNILLPLALTGIQSGLFLVFVPSFGEFAIPGLMGGERWAFAGTVITQYILGNRTLALGTAFTLLSCVVLILALFVLYRVLNYAITRE